MKKVAKPRLLIFVIAYQAEATLRRVLDRIPRQIFDDLDCHVLVVDDASKDRTYEIGREYKAQRADVPLTVLRNELNQGYGGNQKVGYSFAVKQGFDFVAMVHGDGQYAPEELPKLIRPLLANEADAVFGSRMMTRLGALKGGMPLYKFVGNKILTRAQNALLGSSLSEFHSGYRLYRVSTLKRLPFLLNSNAFHFDTEIIIQLLNAKARISELPIPTFYGDEISRVNGMLYAKDIMVSTLKNALHRVGLMYQRRFDIPDADSQSHYTLKVGYPSSHTFALDAVAQGSGVLVLGDQPAGFQAELENKRCTVVVTDGQPKTLQGIDTILMLDRIEHLRDPEAFLDELRTKFDFTPRTLVMTTPNVAFFVQRVMLAIGQFNYGREGILDRTHTRLFTFHSLRQLLDDAGFAVSDVKGIPVPFPKVFGNGMVSRVALAANRLLILAAPTLFSYQIFIRAKTSPGVEFVLNEATKRNG